MRIYLSLGSNIGDRRENLIESLSILQSSGFVDIEQISRFYETSPIGYKQRYFYNISVQAQTHLSALDLLFLLKNIERVMGRKRAKKWSERIIDIDILFYGSTVVKNPNLNIPHKEIENRLFVLIPLAEIAPVFKHPVLHRKIKEILKEKSLTLDCQKIKIAPSI